MTYFEPNYPHYQHMAHPDQYPPHVLALYHDSQQNMLSYGMAQPATAMGPMPPKQSDSKPRLSREEVDILEAEFKKNPKPTTQTKRQFADDMQVELPRINNWFQNRRAKSKHEKRQAALEAGQLQTQDAQACSEPSSPDFLGGFFDDVSPIPVQHAATFPMMNNGPPPPVASYNPQYTDPSTASIESLERTMAVAEAAAQNPGYQAAFVQDRAPQAEPGEDTLSSCRGVGRQQYLPMGEQTFNFDAPQPYSYTPNMDQHFYNAVPQAMPEPIVAQPQPSSHTQPDYESWSTFLDPPPQEPQVLANFPSQLLPTRSQASQLAPSHEGSESQSPEASNPSQPAIDFKYDTVESDSSSPPAPSLPFRSPPPPTDLASRRKKVHVKPAHLVSETLKSRPTIGPRTISHADGLRRPSSDSPGLSPMRRIVSAGGNRNVISGRVSKSGVESAQRSPIYLGGFADAGAFLENSNYHTIRYPNSLTAGSSLNSSLAPPTPMSPRDGHMTLGRSDGSRSTASPTDSGMGLVWNPSMAGCYSAMGGDQKLVSPPETPQALLMFGLHSGNNWMEPQEKAWNYEVPDEPLHTPGIEGFHHEIHMPQPQYLSTMSQPVTPAFGQHFNPNTMFGLESPRFEPEAPPQFAMPMQAPPPAAEYTFPEAQQTQQFPTMPVNMSPASKQKTFQFSNSTPADFTISNK